MDINLCNERDRVLGAESKLFGCGVCRGLSHAQFFGSMLCCRLRSRSLTSCCFLFLAWVFHQVILEQSHLLQEIGEQGFLCCVVIVNCGFWLKNIGTQLQRPCPLSVEILKSADVVLSTNHCNIKAVSGPVVRPTDETRARCFTNGYLRIRHDLRRCNGIEMISSRSLNKSSLFRYFILHVV